MSRRGLWRCVIVLVLAGFPGMVLTADQPKAAKSDAGRGPVSRQDKQAKGAKPVTEDDYELQRMLVDTIDQVQRNYVRKIRANSWLRPRSEASSGNWTHIPTTYRQKRWTTSAPPWRANSRGALESGSRVRMGSSRWLAPWWGLQLTGRA